ncbi:MAG: hypothetical protein KF868_19145 [Acidobacteria bacterium]|nr:hypothetical protein [Acidobacteriota bacterium]MCW5971386.1 hypothetical protein [Blastocatellales bacterium]
MTDDQTQTFNGDETPDARLLASLDAIDKRLAWSGSCARSGARSMSSAMI